jgi:hypothetical protein
MTELPKRLGTPANAIHTVMTEPFLARPAMGPRLIAGFTSGYTETLYKDGDPAKAERVEVTNMVYDKNGLYYDSKTLRGKTDRFKDALRGLSSILFGNGRAPVQNRPSANALVRLDGRVDGAGGQLV